MCIQNLSQEGNLNFRIVGDNTEKKVFKIPIHKLTPEEASKSLKELIDRYKENIEWNEE